MKQIIFIFLFCLCLFVQKKAVGQDMQFTQYYAAPLYLNPAFTGANVCSRVSSNIRNQWPGIGGGYISQILSYDHYFVNDNVGAGLMLTNDAAGAGRLRTTTFSGLAAYHIGITREFAVRVGLQGGILNRNVNFNDLIFGDQIAQGGASSSVETPTQGITSIDFSTGTLILFKTHWMGMAFHHILRTNESLMGEESNRPLKFSMHGGTRIRVGSEVLDDKDQHYLTPTFNYRAQEKFDQLDIGCYYSKSFINLGLWYRGIPLFKAYKKGYPNNDALCFIIGATKDRFKVGYSYDHTISWLRGGTGGAHELSVSYEFCKLKKKKKKFSVVICPKF